MLPDTMNNIPMWAISDTHFNHVNITKYEPIRRTLGKDHNRVMIERWAETVKDNEIILHLGDVALGKSDDFLRIAEQLPGRKLLLRGNHDTRSKAWYAKHGFRLIDNFDIIHRGWKIYFDHYPRNLPYPCHLSVHGHVHSASKNDLKYMNLSVEVIDFRPIRLLEALDTRIDILTLTGKSLSSTMVV